jgi:hypothetical protein
LRLAGIGGGRNVDKQIALGVDVEGMHGMVAGEGKPGDDSLWFAGRDDAVLAQRVAYDAIVHLGVEGTLVKGDAGATVIALLDSVAEAGGDIGLAVAVDVLQSHEESPRRRRIVAVIAAAPGVDVDHAVRGHRQMAGMADMVGEHGRAEPFRQRDAAIVAGAGFRLHRLVGLVRGNGRRACRQQHRHDWKGR